MIAYSGYDPVPWTMTDYQVDEDGVKLKQKRKLDAAYFRMVNRGRNKKN